jgi:O-antigen biosynthesis rhamnosyltransferase
MTKKVLHVYKTFFPETIGGVEQSIYNMCKGVKRHGIESKVVCVAKTTTGKEIIDGIEVTKYPYDISISSCPFSSKLFLNFKKEIERADIIHYHYPWPFGDLLSFLVPKNKKQIVTYHSDIVKQKLLKTLYYPLEQRFLSKVDSIIVTSPNYIEVSKNLKKFRDKAKTLPLSINRGNYPDTNIIKAKEIRKKFGSNFILFIGQLRYYKGLHLLIEAMKELPNNLVIIGTGKEEAKLKKLCKKHNISNVYFLGRVSEEEKVNYLYACYCLALTSHLKSEAFGVSLLEGAAFGKPLLSCKIGTGSEYVNQHMETGLLVKPTVKEIRDAILYFINNPKLAEEMGCNAKKRMEKLFASDIVNYRLSCIYKELLK